MEEAIACFRKAISLGPRYALAYSNLGLIRLWADVVALLKKAEGTSPRVPSR